MRPLYSTLANAYPSRQTVGPAALFAEIGWDHPPARTLQVDLCALRVSLALVRTGSRIPGRINVSRGRFRGHRVEAQQTRLALLLTHSSLLGRPEVYQDGVLAEQSIGRRRGVVSYWCRDPQHARHGHIDIIGPGAEGVLDCGSECYREASEIWFWPLK